jgi:hypothetical protein
MTSVIKLGGFTFQSQEDVFGFMERKMPSNAYYLFHDAFTLLESLSGVFYECKDMLNELYKSQKVGVNAQKARHIASFKTTLLYVLGHIKEGSPNPKHYLPIVKTFKDWTCFDQNSGVLNYILRGIQDLYIQIPQNITTKLYGDEYADARKIAMDMHTNAHVFIGNLCTFITGFVQELLNTSQCGEDEIWELVSACIRKLFEDLCRMRSQATNASSDPNKISHCATYMWSLIESHQIMREYKDSCFQNHPSIAPVITLHFF